MTFSDLSIYMILCDKLTKDITYCSHLFAICLCLLPNQWSLLPLELNGALIVLGMHAAELRVDIFKKIDKFPSVYKFVQNVIETVLPVCIKKNKVYIPYF